MGERALTWDHDSTRTSHNMMGGDWTLGTVRHTRH